MFFSIFGPSVTSVEYLPQILPRTLHVLSLAALSPTPMKPWLASLVRIRNASSVSRTRWLERLARVVTRQCGRISISKTLKELHWLPIKWQIDFKVATMTYKLVVSNEHLECTVTWHSRLIISLRVQEQTESTLFSTSFYLMAWFYLSEYTTFMIDISSYALYKWE